MAKKTPIERFNEKYVIDPITGCWNWTAAGDKVGYGYFANNNVGHYAHRWSYWFHYKIDPGPKLVCHHCDNPSCVNPVHLFLGTQKDNIADCKNKNRTAVGVRNNKAKLTDAEVKLIKYTLIPNNVSVNEIAKMYNVSSTTIRRIKNRESWKHI